MYYKSSMGFSVALVHHSKVITKLTDGDVIFDVPSAVSMLFPEGNKFNAELPLPATTTLGFAFPISDKTAIAIDGSYVHWSIRSEEHTSELQSLMRISYAVFCLKKKNTTI